MSIEAMKQALEALEIVVVDVKTTPTAYEAHRQAITTLRTAIEQAAVPEAHKKQEPAINYAKVYEFAEQYGLDYNFLCKVINDSLATPPAAPTQDSDHQFKNFHSVLCECFGYTHDEVDWKRDQVSLIEWIAKQVKPAAPVQEPVAWMGTDIEGNPNKFRLNPFGGGVALYKKPQFVKVWDAEGYDSLMQQMEMVKAENLRLKSAAPVQEPFDTHSLPGKSFDTHSRTPQRQWVGLTDEEVSQLIGGMPHGKMVRAVEAKLREKNGGQP